MLLFFIYAALGVELFGKLGKSQADHASMWAGWGFSKSELFNKGTELLDGLYSPLCIIDIRGISL